MGVSSYLCKPGTVEVGSVLDHDLQALWTAALDPLDRDFGNLLLTVDNNRMLEDLLFDNAPQEPVRKGQKRGRRDAGCEDRERRVADPCLQDLDKPGKKVKMFFAEESEHNLACLPDSALATKPVTSLVPITDAEDVSQYLALNNPELKLALINK